MLIFSLENKIVGFDNSSAAFLSYLFLRCYGNKIVKLLSRLKLKVGLEFAMAGVRHSAIVNPAGQLLLTRCVNNS